MVIKVCCTWALQQMREVDILVFLLFLHYFPHPHSVSSSVLSLLFSGRWHKMTHKGWHINPYPTVQDNLCKQCRSRSDGETIWSGSTLSVSLWIWTKTLYDVIWLADSQKWVWLIVIQQDKGLTRTQRNKTCSKYVSGMLVDISQKFYIVLPSPLPLTNRLVLELRFLTLTFQCSRCLHFFRLDIFLTSPQKHMLWYPLEVFHRGASNKYPQHVFMEK